MSKILQNYVRSFLCMVLAAFVLGGYDALAQGVVTGEWKADVRTEKAEQSDKIYISFVRRHEKGGKNWIDRTYSYDEMEGLSREQALSGGNTRFSLVHEAGTIDCEGAFQDGRGKGTFRFTPNMQFVSAMKSRGFDFEKTSVRSTHSVEDRLFTAVTLNVTTALADDLLSANFGQLDVDDLFKAAIFKVDSRFMREMKDSGYPNLGMDELVKARIFKIDAEYVRQIVQMGFGSQPFESLVKMRIFKVTPEFISEVRAEGLTDLNVEDLVKMRIFKIDSDFIRQARSEGVPIEVEKLVQRRIGVFGR
jgi:hypothetical protein